MKALTAILILISIFLFGCDGHVRTLYIREPGMQKPNWTKVIIEVDKEIDIPHIVEKIAKKFKLKQEKENNIWWRKEVNGSFQISLNQKQDGMWIIMLIDWPTFIRSNISEQVEKEIRMELKTKPNKISSTDG
ncbi:MAG: hypothetical protein GXP32_00465 [Kiritimatiellaeota bacterium]|nr:hypothetical protein [Kiritimatiellota bacterium]